MPDAPLTLRIGVHDYTVRLFRPDEPHPDAWADCCAELQEIRIGAASGPRQLALLIHEVVHAYWDARTRGRDRLSEEQAASFVGEILADLFVNNPHLPPVLMALAAGATFQRATHEH